MFTPVPPYVPPITEPFQVPVVIAPVLAVTTSPLYEVAPVTAPAIATLPVKFAVAEMVCPFINPEVMAPEVTIPRLELVEKRFVEVAVVEKRFVKAPVLEKIEVVVALVEVEFNAVKFWRVEEPFINKLERLVKPPRAVRVPVKFAVSEIVCPFIKPEVTAPAVVTPKLELVLKRLVDVAVVEKRLVKAPVPEKIEVVVAFVVVLFNPVKF